VEYRHDRAFYRLGYPLFLRPILVVGTDRFVVIDVSEQGLRYLTAGPPPPAGQVLVGTLLLPEEAPLEIEGTVVRRTPPQVAIRLIKGVPFAVMLDQQRLLQQRLVARR
jgi:hypothetical protein